MAVKSKAWHTTWQNFVAADYHPQHFWMYHCNCVVLFTLSLVLTFSYTPTVLVQVRMWLEHDGHRSTLQYVGDTTASSCSVAYDNSDVAHVCYRCWHLLAPSSVSRGT